MKPLNEYERLFGLIGYPLSHSFSKKYFSEKFAKAGITDACYELFPIPKIEALPELLQQHPNLVGLNVTIPYKQAVLPYLDKLSEGAANTIRCSGDQLEGFNTDVVGFETSLCSWLEATRGGWSGLKALVLGTGGAAKAVAFVLGRLEIPFKMVSPPKWLPFTNSSSTPPRWGCLPVPQASPNYPIMPWAAVIIYTIWSIIPPPPHLWNWG